MKIYFKSMINIALKGQDKSKINNMKQKGMLSPNVTIF